MSALSEWPSMVAQRQIVNIDVGLTIPIVQLDPDLPLPSYAHDGDAGLDLYAREDHVDVSAGHTFGVGTGISAAIPDGYVGLICLRSSLGQWGFSIPNAPGVIDSGYRGEISVMLRQPDDVSLAHPTVINRGDRIAQLVIVPVPRVQWQVVESLDETSRGEGGFGSSGR